MFMLREVFGYGYPDVARITGKTEVNCRQILARARQRIAAGGQARDSAPPPARREEGEELARRSFEAAAGGDMDALLGMLAPDVVLHGRRRQGAGDREAAGRAAARHAAARRPAPPGPDPRRLHRRAWVNGQPGAVMYDTEGRVVGVVELDVAEAWSRRSALWSIPTSLVISDRCLMWRDCRIRRTQIRRVTGRSPTYSLSRCAAISFRSPFSMELTSFAANQAYDGLIGSPHPVNQLPVHGGRHEALCPAKESPPARSTPVPFAA